MRKHANADKLDLWEIKKTPEFDMNGAALDLIRVKTKC